MTKIDYTESDIQYENNSDYRQEFDPTVTPSILSEQIQSTVDSIISQCQDVDWNEDLITFKIVENLRGILATYKLPDIVDNYSGNKFNFEAYKLTGKAEQSHGDIAVIITRKFLGKDIPISGVAFYEAKASSSGYRQYPSFCIQQLRRLVTHTPKLSYLIYITRKNK